MASNNDYLLLFFYHLCKRLPNSQLFYSVYTLAKYIGIIVITHNVKRLEDSVFSIPNIFVSLTLFGNGFSKYLDWYLLLISIIIIILLAFIIFTAITLVYFKAKFNKEEDICKPLSLSQSISMKMIAVGWTIISLFSQHIIELFSLEIVNFAYTNDDFLRDKSQGSNYFIFGVSIVGIILCEIFSFGFYCFSKSFSRFGHIGDRNLVINPFSHILMMICTSCQGVCTILGHIDDCQKAHYILNVIFSFLLLFQAIIYMRHFNHYDSNYALFVEKFLLYWALISSIDEIVIFHTCETPFSQSYSLCKIILELVNSFILTQFNIAYIKRFYLNRFIKKIFNEKTLLDHNELLAYENLVYDFKQKRIQFNPLFQLFTHHKQGCATKACVCKHISITKWINQLQGASKDLNEDITTSQITEEAFGDFVIIGEHEITKSLCCLHKQRENNHLVNILINLHIEYILYIKNDLRRALYFSSQYLRLYQPRLSFLYLLYLFEYKNESYSKLTAEKIKGEHKKLGEQTLNQKHYGNALFNHPTQLFEFTIKIQNIRKVLIKCSDYLAKINDFRKTIESKANYSSSIINSETFIDYCRQYKKNHIQLCKLITNIQINNSNKQFKHYETCYLLSIYFQSSMQAIPKKLMKVFKIIPTYDFFIMKNGSINSYKNFDVSNPLLIFINKKDDFIIKYISTSLCNELKYSYQDIINTSFDQLIPNETVLLHKIFLKKFFLTTNISFKSSKFILDTKKNLIPIHLIAKPFPTLQLNFGISFSIQFNNKAKELEKDYYLLLDKDWNILSTNQQFSKEFFFTLQMLNMLKTTFSSFFGVNMDRIKMKAKAIFNKGDNTKYQSISLEEENHVLIPFSNGKQDSMFRDRKISDIHDSMKRVRKYVIHGHITQNSMIKNLENVNQMIDEMGFDIEWYTRVNCLKERIIIAGGAFCLKATYTMKRIEKLIYTIVHLKEIINHNQKDAIEMIKKSILKLDFYHVIKAEIKESNQSITKYDKELMKRYRDNKYKSSSPINNHEKNINGSNVNSSNVNYTNDLNELSSSKTKNQLGNNTSHSNNQSISPSSSFKKDAQTSVSALPSQNSSLGLNKTNSALLNLSSSIAKRSIFERSSINLPDSNYEYRKLFLHQKLKNSMVHIPKILCLCLLILSLFSFVFNTSIKELNRSLFYINIYSLFLKSDIYFSSLNILSSCEFADLNFKQELIAQRERLLMRANEIISHFTSFSKSLNTLVNTDQVKPIFSIINSNDDYSVMHDNYEMGTRSSSLYDELLYIHYFLMQLSNENSFQICRIQALFVNKQYEHFLNVTPGPSYEETIVYYVFSNVLFSLRHKMEQLAKTSNIILKDYVAQCQLSILGYNLAIFTLLALIFVSFSIIVIYDKNNIQILLNIIYTKKSTEDKYDNQLKAFRIILESFSTENCIKYEKIVKNQATMPLVNLKTQKKMREKRNYRSNMKDSKQDSHNINNNQFRIKAYSTKLTTPKLVSYSFCLIIFLITILIAILLTDFLLSRALYNYLILVNVISIYFVDQIPEFTAMYLYSKISIVVNDINYLTTPIEDYNQASYSNYYDITIDTTSDTVFVTLKESEYAFFHYQFIQIKQNLNMFMYVNQRKSLLSRTTAWTNKLNTKEGLCIYSGVGFNIYSKTNKELVPLMASISDIALKCSLIGKGIGMNSLNDFFEFSNKELTNIYIDFASLDHEARNPIDFLTLDLFMSFSKIIDVTLKYIHNTYIYFMFDDLNQMFVVSNYVNVAFSFILVFAGFCVFIYIHFVLFNKIEEKVTILTFIQKMLLNQKLADNKIDNV